MPGSLPPGCQQLNQPGDLSACTRWTPQPVTVFASRLGSARVPSCGCPGGCHRAGSRGCHPSACCQLGAAGDGGSAQRGTHGGDTRPCPARNLRPRGSGRFSCTLLGRFLRRHKPGSLQIPLRWGWRCMGLPSDPNHSPPAPGVPVSLGVTPPLQSSQGQCAAKGSTPPPPAAPTSSGCLPLCAR